MKKVIIVFSVLTVMFLFTGALRAEFQFDGFSFETVDGRHIEFDSLKGTPMVINIGAYWWKKCIREAPELQRAYMDFRKKGVFFLGVFVLGKDYYIRQFAKRHHLTFPVGKENGIAKRLDVKSIPATIFIGRDGTIKKNHTGEIKYEEIVKAIKEILKQ